MTKQVNADELSETARNATGLDRFDSERFRERLEVLVASTMRDEFDVQCDFCTPDVVITLAAMTAAPEAATEEAMLEALSGHLCRRTGYQGMRRAVRCLAKAGDVA